MSEFSLCAYWKNRPITFRQYADSVKNFLPILAGVSGAFRQLQWAGDRPASEIVLANNFQGLDQLIYEHAGDADQVYDKRNPDGTPTWESVSPLGFTMIFNTMESSRENGITLSFSAGIAGDLLQNSVVISFPEPDHACFKNREFFDYEFIKHLFIKTIQYWDADDGVLFSNDFADKVDEDGLPGVGWLTYLRDPRTAALNNDIRFKDLLFEEVEGGGTLITLNRQIIDANNPAQVSKARLLRNILIEQQLIDV